jgi:hypothetical protein
MTLAVLVLAPIAIALLWPSQHDHRKERTERDGQDERT